tara:strand:+ start:43 stop:624 length:582 start_codon:yes stop_codon:yes gene_type:complete
MSNQPDNKLYYSFDFWFNNDEHDEWHQGGEDYYVNKFYENIVFKLDIPTDGYICVLGTHRCVSFDKLCKHFGYERCIGYDLHNPTNHSRVIIKDVLDLDDSIPIAFCHNDIGSFSYTPYAKIKAQEWAVKNIVHNGYLLGNNNLNRLKWKVEEYMINNDFINRQFSKLDKNKYKLHELPYGRIEGYMLSKKSN